VALVLDDRPACSGLLDDAEAVELVDDGFVLVFMASRQEKARRVGTNGFVLLGRHADPVEAVCRPALTDERECRCVADVAHDRLIASPEDALVLGTTLLASRHGSHIPHALQPHTCGSGTSTGVLAIPHTVTPRGPSPAYYDLKPCLDRLAMNEALFRDINERINEGSMRLQPFDGDEPRYWLFVCECASAACVDHIEVTKEEYEEVRADPTHFAVLPGHENPDLETVAWRTERFVVVEKRVARDQLEASETRV